MYEHKMLDLLSGYGSDIHMNAKGVARGWLVNHPEIAYPKLLSTVRTYPIAANIGVILELLPYFERKESLPLLEEELWRGIDDLSVTAGIAIAMHDGDEAREVLLRALSSPFPETVEGAAYGLRVRFDLSTCDALVPVLQHPDEKTRWSVVRAAHHIGCLSNEMLSEIAVSDPAPDIRDSAAKLLKPKP